MAIKITPPEFNVKNMPIEVASTRNAQLFLNIGTTSGANDLFKGTIDPLPTETSTSVDIQPFVYDLVNLNAIDLGFGYSNAVYLQPIANASKGLFISTKQGTTADFSLTVKYLVNKNLTFAEWFRYKDKLTFGAYKSYMDNKIASDIDWTIDGAVKCYDDVLPHNYYTYNRINDTDKTRRVWNKVLGTAPVFVSMFSNYVASKTITIKTYSYADKLATAVLNTTFGTKTKTMPSGTMELFSTTINDSVPLFSYSFVLPASPEARVLYFERVPSSCFTETPYQIYWVNRRGGVDYQIMSGKAIKSKSTTKEKYSVSKRKYSGGAFIGTPSQSVDRVLLTNEKVKYSLNTGFLKESEYSYLEDLSNASQIWLYDDRTKSITAVSNTDSNFTFKNFRNDKMFTFTINLEEQIENIIL